VIFYAIYKKQPKVKHYLRSNFHRGPSKFLQVYNHAPTFHKTPQKHYKPCNVIPGRRPAAVRPNSGEPAAGTGRARAGDGPRAPWVNSRARLGAWSHRRARPAQPRGGGRWNGGCSGLAAKARRPKAWLLMAGVCASANGLWGAGEGSSRELGAGTAMAAWTAACPRRNAAVPVL
jgi:hypothetical protein